MGVEDVWLGGGRANEYILILMVDIVCAAASGYGG